MSHSTNLRVVPLDECIGLLAAHQVGRLCINEEGFPVAFPVNYRLIPNSEGGVAIVVRTRPGSTLDRESEHVGFEIDGIDGIDETGWSVVVRGILHHEASSITPAWLRAWDPHPWVGPQDAWLYITPISISGRRLTAEVVEWAFAIRGYL
jgi:Pyridoxamine 5'-phosphate oxidase